MFRKILLRAIFSCLYFVSASQNYITLYEDCNYSGKKYNLEAGSYEALPLLGRYIKLPPAKQVDLWLKPKA
jgi:hypothetical protein